LGEIKLDEWMRFFDISLVKRGMMKLEGLAKIPKRWKTVVWLLIISLVLVFLIRSFLPLASPQLKPDLPQLSLDNRHRILVLAPHCDDETLGSAGLLLAAIRAGLDVRVTVATNGDGYLFATMEEFHQVYPTPEDFIHMGEIRQQESLAALRTLGIELNQVYFLSYPDRGTPSLWNDYWESTHPYRSPYSEETHSPYPITYDPKAVYAGEDYLRDLVAILKDFRPDLVIYPHPEDVHPDHWGLNAFTRLAIALLSHQDPTFSPAEYTYLVHRPDFPTVKGLKPQESLLPPPALYQIDSGWYRWNLDARDVLLKGQAISQYRSQLPLLHKLLFSFDRINELFAPVVTMDLPVIGQGDPLNPSTWKDPKGQPILPVQIDPDHDELVPNTIPSSDITDIYMARESMSKVWMCAGVVNETSHKITYYLRLKSLNENGIIQYGATTGRVKEGWHIAIRSNSFVCDQIDLADLGNPWAIDFGVDTEGPENTILDRSAWQLLYLQW
jgi:LmbE family N-acetylglucosaminyl deacetylase